MTRQFHVEVAGEEISFHDLRKAFIGNPEAMSGLLAEVLNTFDNPATFGVNTGKVSRDPTHRTTQRSIVAFALGVIVGMAENDTGTDPRNESAIEVAEEIRDMVADGELDVGPMI